MEGIKHLHTFVLMEKGKEILETKRRKRIPVNLILWPPINGIINLKKKASFKNLNRALIETLINNHYFTAAAINYCSHFLCVF